MYSEEEIAAWDETLLDGLDDEDLPDVSELLNHYAQSNTELSRAITALEQQNYELRKKVFDSLEGINQHLDDLEGLKEQLGVEE